ncbi:uncharacterized protein LOC143223594 [Tachypleus tridentatus]|uniref:uncharacterized protein LOC143223594 n=1 Tax=Tachypleus tridentatus TaxID=6853 RepID=UPI003FD35C17
MVVLCVSFLACWVPLMLTIITAQLDQGRKHKVFYRVADICMALNFILDPVIYVLSRRPHRRDLKSLMKPFCLDCFPQIEWINSNGSRASQRNSGFPWNFGMSAANFKPYQDEMPKRLCDEERHEDNKPNTDFPCNELKCRENQTGQDQFDATMDQDPTTDESRIPMTGFQHTFCDPFAVQIRIQDGCSPSVSLWNSGKKEWSESIRGKWSCCKINRCKEFLSENCTSVERIPAHDNINCISINSRSVSHSLPDPPCLRDLVNPYLPDSQNRGTLTSEHKRDTHTLCTLTIHHNFNSFSRHSTIHYLSDPSGLESSTIHHHPESPRLRSSTVNQPSDRIRLWTPVFDHHSEPKRPESLATDQHSGRSRSGSLVIDYHSEPIRLRYSVNDHYSECRGFLASGHCSERTRLKSLANDHYTEHREFSSRVHYSGCTKIGSSTVERSSEHTKLKTSISDSQPKRTRLRSSTVGNHLEYTRLRLLTNDDSSGSQTFSTPQNFLFQKLHPITIT